MTWRLGNGSGEGAGRQGFLTRRAGSRLSFVSRIEDVRAAGLERLRVAGFGYTECTSMRFLRSLFSLLLFPALTLAQASHSAGANAPDALMNALTGELNRASTSLAKTAQPPYFISYSVDDTHTLVVVGVEGALVNSTSDHSRIADISVRVGDHQLDSTHGGAHRTAIHSVALPIEDDPAALARVLWQGTDYEYRQAMNSFLQSKGSNEVRAKDEDDNSADFSTEQPHVSLPQPEAAHPLEAKLLEQKAREYSGLFRKYPEVYYSTVVFQYRQTDRYFASTDGTKVVTPDRLMRMYVLAATRADDGMDMMRTEFFDSLTPEGMPSDAEVGSRIEKMATDLKKLRTAPTIEPYAGPALLSGRAAAVFFHEVLGHRLEGQRQRGDNEGQTFAKQIGQKVLPDFLTVVDDPTQRKLGDTLLSGYYQYDDEGQPAQRVDLIDSGVLKSFLMSRMPVKGFDHSNGHGRAQTGLFPVGRQGNLIVSSSKKVADADLRKALLDEIKKQGKPYGLYFEDISGGFTLTQRQTPQAFQVMPVMVWKVYADGRADELVRGVNIVGTPLTVLTRIMLTGDKTEVFDGECGAESGSIPVAAAAPAMLISEVEVAKQEQQHQRPPILPPPGSAADTAAEVRK
jgi:TldD protein